MKHFELSPYDGALLIDKPAGPTSHDVVDAIRHILGIQKVGHCGTLDPNATGLLIIVIGKATKISDKLTSADKVYEGTMHLGICTDTFDADGKIVSTKEPPDVTVDDLNRIAEKFIGDIQQLPPMVSAVKKDGVPLYKLARKGISVEREPRRVHIYDFKFTDYVKPVAYFYVACTKGTYVRSLANDFGEELGCGAHLRNLRRTISGKFNVKDAVEFEEVIKMTPEQLQKHIIPLTELAKKIELI